MLTVRMKQKVNYLLAIFFFLTSDESDTHRCFLVNRFDDKLLIIERDVSNLTPGEANLWRQPDKRNFQKC